MGARDFRQLKVWEKSHQLALEIYKTTGNFPREEVYGMVSQMRRSAVSIPTNIAEGCGRSGDKDFARYLQIAFGSASELEYQILLAHDLNFVDGQDYDRLTGNVIEIKRMLYSFMRRLNVENNSLKAEG